MQVFREFLIELDPYTVGDGFIVKKKTY